MANLKQKLLLGVALGVFFGAWNVLAAWVAHDLGHAAQAARVMAKQYRDAVEPWREYLPVLDR